MKKICFVVTDAISFNVLCKGQLEYFKSTADVQMAFICGGDVHEVDKLRARDLGAVYDIGLVRRPSLLNDVVGLFRLIVLLLLNRFDLIIYSTPKALALTAVAAFLTRQRRRVALIRGRVYEGYPEGLVKSIWRSVDRLCCLFSHKVVFISRSLRDAYVAERLLPEAKAHVVGAGSSNGVEIPRSDEREVAFAAADLRAKYGIRPEDFLIVLVGRICRDKGICDLSDIIRLVCHPSVKVLLVGRVEDELGRQVVDQLSACDPRVKHIGYLDGAASIFAIADLHLFLSHREGFGNVALEAAVAGVPTFAYDVVGVRDSVVHGVSGRRFRLGDTGGIAAAIDDYARLPKLRREQYSSSRAWAESNFAREKVWADYLRFYLSA